jgi:hypothetical protein
MPSDSGILRSRGFLTQAPRTKPFDSFFEVFLRSFFDFCGNRVIDVNPFGKVASLVFSAFLRKNYVARGHGSSCCGAVTGLWYFSPARRRIPPLECEDADSDATTTNLITRSVASTKWNAMRSHSGATKPVLKRRNARSGPLAVCDARSGESWTAAIRSVVNRHMVANNERDERLDPTPFRAFESAATPNAAERSLLYECINFESSGLSRLRWPARGASANFLDQPALWRRPTRP